MQPSPLVEVGRVAACHLTDCSRGYECSNSLLLVEKRFKTYYKNHLEIIDSRDFDKVMCLLHCNDRYDI